MNDIDKKAEKSVEISRKIWEWIRAGDRGVSSETMAAIALGATSGLFDAPYDPSDFGCCYRLLEKVPEIREFFPKISELVPSFRGIIREWDTLSDLFIKQHEFSYNPELYERIKSLREESGIS